MRQRHSTGETSGWRRGPAGASTFDATANASGVIPVGTATIGYRYASSDGGFLFRAGCTPLIFVTTEPKGVYHWGGLSFGYRF